MKHAFNFGDDVIHSTYLNELLAELKSEVEDLEYLVECAQSELDDANNELSELSESDSEYDSVKDRRDDFERGLEDAQKELDHWHYGHDLEVLEDLIRSGQSYNSDWNYGVDIIRDTHFDKYIQSSVEDNYDMSVLENWPFSLLEFDWEEVANSAMNDYAELSIEGYTYFVECN